MPKYWMIADRNVTLDSSANPDGLGKELGPLSYWTSDNDDVDKDLFRAGEVVDASDGDAIANLCYRVSVLYTPMST